MIQVVFTDKVKTILEKDDKIIGLAVGGSWITNEIDDFSDLDLIIVSKETIADNVDKMLNYANKFGNLLNGFTGEHVGEPRLLICLYDNPLLHVDLKFVTLQEFKSRVETPTILLDKGEQLKNEIKNSSSDFPYPDYQWIEDRFWIWIHYALLKIGRGENLEALDFFGFLRMVVLGPLTHINNKNLPRGVRKIEFEVKKNDFKDIVSTIPEYSSKSLLTSLRNSIQLYRKLRDKLYDRDIILRLKTEKRVLLYFNEIEKMIKKNAVVKTL